MKQIQETNKAKQEKKEEFIKKQLLSNSIEFVDNTSNIIRNMPPRFLKIMQDKYKLSKSDLTMAINTEDLVK